MKRDVKVVPFAAEQWMNAKIKDNGMGMVGTPYLSYYEGLSRMGPAYTLLVDGETVASMGFVLCYRGVAEAWTLMGELVGKYGRILHRIVSKCVEDFQFQQEWHRIQCYVLADKPEHAKWVRHLGFQFESLCKWMGPNKEDMLRFVRLRG